MTVLVAGAGPVGLTLASELARHGVKPRVIERLASRSDKSRALVLWPRSLELLHKAGCVEPFLHAGIPLHGMSIFNEHKARLVHKPHRGQGMNTGMQDAFNLGWKMALVLTGRAAAEPLLTSYSAERVPVGAAVVEGTGTARRVITLRHPVAQEVRNRLMSFVSGCEVVQQRLREQATELAIKYPKSPLNRDVHQGHAAWLLGRGIHPGDRAPDGDLVSPTGTASSLFELMTGTAFHLLLLAGQARPDSLLDVAQWVQRTYPALVATHWIDTRQRAGVWEHSFWLDPEGAVHRLYGTSEPSLYLLRPDGYVGLRCQPAARAVLEEYLLSLGLQAPVAALS